jgi:hypothetical protein
MPSWALRSKTGRLTDAVETAGSSTKEYRIT